ncbi:MAG: helix-turn-helix domain-containing protein [Lachnospiraceae bacterium]|nr:helix-turn-helix domain-containing protein [Lachnospiraceae bacterium]
MTDKEQKKIFSNNINFYISQSGKQQKDIAKDLGYSPTTFNTWCVGKIVPSASKIQRIADYFNIGKSDLLDDKSMLLNQKRSQKGIVINVLSRIFSDNPIDAIENIIDTEIITEELAQTGKFFGLQIHGDSMEPRMHEGDIVIVRQQEDAESGDIVIALVNGNDATCKRLTKYYGGIALTSLNSKYDPIMYSNEEIISKSAKIIGKVVELRGKL